MWKRVRVEMQWIDGWRKRTDRERTRIRERTLVKFRATNYHANARGHGSASSALIVGLINRRSPLIARSSLGDLNEAWSRARPILSLILSLSRARARMILLSRVCVCVLNADNSFRIIDAKERHARRLETGGTCANRLTQTQCTIKAMNNRGALYHYLRVQRYEYNVHGSDRNWI